MCVVRAVILPQVLFRGTIRENIAYGRPVRLMRSRVIELDALAAFSERARSSPCTDFARRALPTLAARPEAPTVCERALPGAIRGVCDLPVRRTPPTRT